MIRQLLIVTCFVVAACKGKPERKEPPAANGAAVGSGSASATHEDIHLPKGDGSAPKKTTGPLPKEVGDKLRGLKFPRFNAEQKGGDQAIAMVYTTDDRPKLRATVQIKPCSETPCMPPNLEQWKARKSLKIYLTPELVAAADTKFDIGETELNGTSMIYTYQLGLTKTNDGGTAYSDAYVLYYNDGNNEIRVIAQYADNQPQSREAMVGMASQDDLEHLAKAFVDVFTQAWAD